MIVEPIVVREPIYKETEYKDTIWSYRAMLDLFNDDTNLVKPLVLRCQKYEFMIDELINQIKILSEPIVIKEQILMDLENEWQQHNGK